MKCSLSERLSLQYGYESDKIKDWAKHSATHTRRIAWHAAPLGDGSPAATHAREGAPARVLKIGPDARKNDAAFFPKRRRHTRAAAAPGTRARASSV